MNNFYIISAKNFAFTIIGIILLISLCLMGNTLVDTVVESSVNNRLLPIYSVETNEKIVAITFDCAWRCR